MKTQREKDLALIWKHTHNDFKGVDKAGNKSILILRIGGTHLVSLSDLTDEEIARKLAYAQGQEERLQARKVAAKAGD